MLNDEALSFVTRVVFDIFSNWSSFWWLDQMLIKHKLMILKQILPG